MQIQVVSLSTLETLSGDTEVNVNIEKVEPLYRFLARQDARRSEEFKQKPLIFTSKSRTTLVEIGSSVLGG